MKTCLTCGHVSEDAVPTCPRDGEASWLQTVVAFADPAPVDAEAPTDPAPGDDSAPASMNRAARRAAKAGQ